MQFTLHAAVSALVLCGQLTQRATGSPLCDKIGALALAPCFFHSAPVRGDAGLCSVLLDGILGHAHLSRYGRVRRGAEQAPHPALLFLLVRLVTRGQPEPLSYLEDRAAGTADHPGYLLIVEPRAQPLYGATLFGAEVILFSLAERRDAQLCSEPYYLAQGASVFFRNLPVRHLPQRKRGGVDPRQRAPKRLDTHAPPGVEDRDPVAAQKLCEPTVGHFAERLRRPVDGKLWCCKRRVYAEPARAELYRQM